MEKNNYYENVGKNILSILKEKGMTNSDLANAIGISKQVMGKIIKGQKAINIHEISIISKALNVSMEDLTRERNEIIEEPKLYLHGDFSDNTKGKIEFLNTVIKEIILMEEALGD